MTNVTFEHCTRHARGAWPRWDGADMTHSAQGTTVAANGETISFTATRHVKRCVGGMETEVGVVLYRGKSCRELTADKWDDLRRNVRGEFKRIVELMANDPTPRDYFGTTRKDGVESGLTGPDWEPTDATRFYAQRLGDPKGGAMGFGSTREAALGDLAAREARNATQSAAATATVQLAASAAPDPRDTIQTDADGRQYIDMTPTWVEILPTLLVLHRDANAKGQASAFSELRRMAELADKYVAAQKALKA
jgi:hypothetical protein